MHNWFIIIGIIMHALSGVPGLFHRNTGDERHKDSVILSVSGSLIGIIGAVLYLFRPPTVTEFIRIDGVTVLFLIPIFLISALGGIYGLGYWNQTRHPGKGIKLRFFYGTMTAALATVAISANSILFLTAWEIMALSAFFLITTESDDSLVCSTGWVYLATTHISTLCLFALFAILRSVTGSFEIGPLSPGILTPAAATTIFILSLVAFGCKAGLMPLHIWLPGAHAMAPSHVSAMMSGVLIKIGIYGLIRMISWLPDPPLWWGGMTIAAGAISGILGVVLALGQHDLKRLLAYHSIENIGIIVMGLGLALAGISMNCIEWTVLGLAGAMLHVWNHGLFKSLLFLSAGAVIHSAHTREIDHMGGLAKVMPLTAVFFALGAAAICGLPPLNGFVSELLIYIGAFRALGIGQSASYGIATFIAPALAIIGALAVACFVKAFGAVFLGQARSRHVEHVSEVDRTMTGPMLILAAACVIIGIAPFTVAPILDKAIGVCSIGLSGKIPQLATLIPLTAISTVSLMLLALCAIAGMVLYRQIKNTGAVSGITWDCGYAAPSARMQYTASSFAQIISGMFSWVQQPRIHTPGTLSLFAEKSKFHSHVVDLVFDSMLKPAFRLGVKMMSSFRVLQAGHIHAYIFYIMIILIVLLLWR